MALSVGQAPQFPGRFGTDSNSIKSVDYVRDVLAVKQGWKPSIDKVVTYKVKDGVTLPVLKGPVGSQVDLGVNKYLSGGANQIQISINRGEDLMDYLDVVNVRPIK